MPLNRRTWLALPALSLVLLSAARDSSNLPHTILHAQLDASTPAEDDTLRLPLDTVRLEFSARVMVDATRLVLVRPDRDSVVLAARSGSADGSVIVAAAPSLGAGAHVLRWRTTSADGHVLSGAIPFLVSPEAVPSPPAMTDPDSARAAPILVVEAPPPSTTDFAPILPLLRALGTGLLLALAGGLLFASRSVPAADALQRLLTAFALAAPFAVFAELVTWTTHVAGTVDLSVSLQLATGKALLARMVLAAAALAVWVLTRSARAAALLAFVAVLAGGALGHAAAVSSALAIPLRAVHMAAAAVWLGGLITLSSMLRSGPARLPQLRAVSTAALWSFGVIAVTGLSQALVLLGSPAALLQTGYGRVVLVKATGLIALAAFGYRHRRIIATLPKDGDGAILRSSVRLETVVFIGLIVVSAALSFTPLPE